MLKQVLQDYRSQFKDALHRLDTYFLLPYIVMPVYYDILNLSVWSYILCWGVGDFLVNLYPNEMSKTMLLCPLSEKQKKNYFWIGYWVRIVTPMVLFFLVESGRLLWLCWFGKIDQQSTGTYMGSFFLRLGMLFMGLAALNITCRPEISRSGTRKYSLKGYGNWRVGVQLVSFLFACIFDEFYGRSFWITFLLIVMFWIQVFLCWKIWSIYKNDIVTLSIHFEVRPVQQKGVRKK